MRVVTSHVAHMQSHSHNMQHAQKFVKADAHGLFKLPVVKSIVALYEDSTWSDCLSAGNVGMGRVLW